MASNERITLPFCARGHWCAQHVTTPEGALLLACETCSKGYRYSRGQRPGVEVDYWIAVAEIERIKGEAKNGTL